tara:strand:+ start:419 stop:826 length:408 start_codon:yes stop_codon:yes gene_type:complete
MAIVLKTKESIAANRAANNARIAAANTRAGKTSASMAAEREQIKARHAAASAKVQSTGSVSAPAAVVQAKARPVARPVARRSAVAAPKKVAPVAAPAQNMSSEIMSREVPNRKMVDRVHGLKTTPVRKSSWNWSV